MSDTKLPATAARKRSSKTKVLKKSPSATHPKYTEMITSAVKALRKPRGSTRQAIAKYILSNYDLPSSGVNKRVTKNIKAMVDNKQLVLATGVGVADRYKPLKKSTSAEETRTSKTNKVTKKRAAAPKKKKKPSARSRASPKKKRAVKRRSPVKKRKSPKKTVRRSAKKPGRKPRR